MTKYNKNRWGGVCRPIYPILWNYFLKLSFRETLRLNTR